jgi:hypothetical protein
LYWINPADSRRINPPKTRRIDPTQHGGSIKVFFKAKKKGIKDLQSALDDYNGSGEGCNFDLPQGSATPQEAKDAANIPFWDFPL